MGKVNNQRMKLLSLFLALLPRSSYQFSSYISYNSQSLGDALRNFIILIEVAQLHK